MGLIIGLIVNSVLLSIPLGGSLGALFAIRPFRDEIVPIKVDTNHIIETSICSGDFHLFAQNKNGLNYLLNSNENLEISGPDSTLCLNMTTYENTTYPYNFTAPPFSFTWEYPFLPVNATSLANETKPYMHAFPQAQVDGGSLPVQLQNLGQMNIDLNWTMGPGNAVSTTSLLPLSAHQVNASVVLDMYMDPNQVNAANASSAAFEMLIMFAKFGLQDPVGFGTGNGSTIVMTKTIGGVDFQLFVGPNSAKQSVYTWVATHPVETFTADIAPLFLDIIALPQAEALEVYAPSFADYLGYVGFGVQAYNSVGNVTFSVPKLTIDVEQYH